MMKKLFGAEHSAQGASRRRAAKAAAVLAMALAVAVGGAGTASLLAQQPAALTVETTIRHEGAANKKQKSKQKTEPETAADSMTAAEETVTETEPAEKTEASASTEAAAPEETADAPTAQPADESTAVPAEEAPAENAADAAQPETEVPGLEEENSIVMLQEETPELAALDPQAPVNSSAEDDTASQHTPEGSMLLTPEEIQQALDDGALEEAEAQCIDFGDENGFFQWLWNWIFGIKEEPVYSGWRTENGKTYYYSQSTNKKVTGIQSIDGKLYYFDASGVLQNGVTFGIDVSKYQSGINWNKIKKAGVSFVIIRIGYRGYGASGTLVKDPMFEEHFTNARNAGLKVGVYFFTQATTEDEAREEAQGCNWALNGRTLDYPIFYDTEASTAPNGTGRADGLGVEDRTKCAIAFCEEVKALGYQPGVYASTTWFRKRINYDTLRSRYTIWNAHYGVSSSPIGCDMWQGTEKARIDGYSGELDANISYIG